MISRIVIGRQFAGVIQYQFAGHQHNPVDKQATLLLSAGIRTDSVEHMITDFNRGREQNPRLGKAVLHTSLSFNPDDAARLDDKLMRSIARAYLKKMDLHKTQFIVVRHRDCPGHEHLHIVANRVANDGHTIPDSHNYSRSQKALKELITEFDLTPTNGQRIERQRPENMRRGEQTKHTLRTILAEELAVATQPEEFKQALHQRGVAWQQVHSEKGKLLGCRFTLDNMTTSGSKLGAEFSLPAITARLQKNTNHGQQALEQKWQPAYERELARIRQKNLEIQGYNEPLLRAQQALAESSPAINRLHQALQLVSNPVYQYAQASLQKELRAQQEHVNRVHEVEREQQLALRAARGILGFGVGSKAQEAQAKLRLMDRPELAATEVEKQWVIKVQAARGPEPPLHFHSTSFLRMQLPEPTLTNFALEQEEKAPYQREVRLDHSKAYRSDGEQHYLFEFREQLSYAMDGDKLQVVFAYDVRDPKLSQILTGLHKLHTRDNVSLKCMSEEHKQEINNKLREIFAPIVERSQQSRNLNTQQER